AGTGTRAFTQGRDEFLSAFNFAPEPATAAPAQNAAPSRPSWLLASADLGSGFGDTGDLPPPINGGQPTAPITTAQQPAAQVDAEGGGMVPGRRLLGENR